MSRNRTRPDLDAEAGVATPAAPEAVGNGLEGAAAGRAEPEALAYPRRRRRRSVPLVVLLLVLGGAAWGVREWWRERRVQAPEARSGHVVRRGDLPILIAVSGNLEALRSEVIKSKVEGQATIISLVDEGTIITEEDVKSQRILVELDSSQIREQLGQQEIAFAGTEAAYKQAKEAYEIQKSENESKIKQGELNVKFSAMDFEAYVGQALATDALAARVDLLKLAEQLHEEAGTHRGKVEVEVARSVAEVEQALRQAPGGPEKPAENGSEPGEPATNSDVTEPGPQTHRLGGTALQKKRKLDADIDLAFEEFKRAADKLIWTTKLERKGYVTHNELEADELAVRRQQIALDQALTARELFLRYEFPKQGEEYLTLYQERGRELERINARARSALAQADAEHKSSEAKYLVQKSRVETLRRQLANCVMRATTPGLVVYGSSGGHWRYGGNPIQIGGSVYERQEILKLPDISSLAVKVRIHESVIDKVKVGLLARVRIDAFPNRRLNGKVLKIAVLPSSQYSWLNPDLKEYETEIGIEGEIGGLKPGMTAQVEVDVKTLQDVLCVPVQAVGTQEGKTVVYVLHEDGREEPTEVQLGESNEKVVEVCSGLSEGQRILREAPQAVPVKEEREAEKEKSETKEPAEEVGPPTPPKGEEGAPERAPGGPRPPGQRPEKRRGGPSAPGAESPSAAPGRNQRGKT